ncbi:P-loop containing nucleoside triphosphate hydrolase protein [Meredithblackwellia eburnea MCA 4105]
MQAGLLIFALIQETVDPATAIPVQDLLDSVSLIVLWAFCALIPIVRPPKTAPWKLFIVYLATVVSELATVLLAIVAGGRPALEKPRLIPITQLFISLSLAGVSTTYPFQHIAKRQKAGPEDYLQVWEWMTFSWMQPVINKGRKARLEESDVWNLSPFLRSEVLYRRFLELKERSLAVNLLVANSLDLTLFLGLSIISSFLPYVSPYLMNRILTSLTNPTPTSHREAFVLAICAFMSSLLKSQSDLYQLWHSRRACTRARSTLMGLIYGKALRRKDMSGVVSDDSEGGSTSRDRDSKKKKEKEDEEKSGGADIGKVVNLMSSDATTIANQILTISWLISAPFELIFAISFLYRLLGWSALAGLSMIVIAVPFNFAISRLEISINKKMRAAKDVRMTAVTELVESCRTVKYFAWENIWLERVFKTRDIELGWVLRDRIASMGMMLLWTLIPDAITLTAFFCFTKVAGQQLTIPIAFTSIALFQQVRMPLNNLPQGILGLLQTFVSIRRIEGFLHEPEIPEWVSSLGEIKKPASASRIGFDNASFKWASKEGARSSPSAPSPNVALSTSITSQAPSREEQLSLDDQEFQLENISLDFPMGALSLVTGPTGSGKTSLLMALLGEMSCTSGVVHLPKSTSSVGDDGLSDSTALCAQRPWLEHASIRDNIVFGARFVQGRYDAVLDACALRPDLKQLEDGDKTEIGEKGVSLSGGQKARVALARAAYSNARHVLLDDPLSAVDHHTAKHIYEELFTGPLMKGRTLILVTHHMSLCLPTARYLVALSEGAVTVTIQDPSNTTPQTAEIVKVAALKNVSVPYVADGEIPLSPGTVSSSSTSTKIGETDEENILVETSDSVKLTKSPRKLIQDEGRATGNIKWQVYRTYLEEVGWGLWVLIVFVVALARCIPVVQQVWLKIWGESYSTSFHNFFFDAAQNYPNSPSISISSYHLHAGTNDPVATPSSWRPNFPPANENPTPYLWVYFGIAMSSTLLWLLCNALSAWGTVRAARSLFRKCLTRVVRAPSRWFDTTPVGRILNRFSSDFETVDWRLDMSASQTIVAFFGFLSAMIVVLVSVPSFIIPAFLIVGAYFSMGVGYVKTSRDIRRMMSNSRSPIFAGFGETLAGIVTIRAFSAENRFQQRLFARVDAFVKMDWCFWMLNRLVLLRFDITGATAVFATTMLVLATGVNPGLAALAIASSQSLVLNSYWLARFITYLEVDLNAIERIDDLLHTEQEPPSIIESSRPAANWPSDVGGLVLEDLVIRYAPDLPDVIKGLSVEFRPKEKVGVVGRTGSGKSTLAMSLLRFVDPSGGKIILDGIDITSIGVADLRSRVTIIPQEAVLFSGTIRSNLDPFTEHTEEELWDVLDSVRLSNSNSASSQATPQRVDSSTDMDLPCPGETVSGTQTPNGNGRISITNLEAPVSAGGGNLSQGQRQLLALARSLLRRSKVIIMDEATASVDFRTDAIIQAAIREGFQDSLVLTIAHRLQTVIDYDRILVLEHGRMVEFDSPKNLLLRKNSIFRSMCEKGADWEEVKKRVGVD